MFYSITGALLLTDVSSAVLECNGIAYRLTVSGNTLSKLGGKKENVRLFTYLQVREDALELFGFFEQEELDTFKLLITVSGVGPKAAMAILSVLTPEKLAFAVGTGDVKSISSASGVGKKTAERVILELKDKLAKQLETDGENAGAVFADTPASGNKLSEATNALMVLGYTRSEALAALKSVDVPRLSLEDCITTALKLLMK